MTLLQSIAGALAYAAALTAAPFVAAEAAAEGLTTRYNVSLIGFPVGRASFDTEIDGNRYSVKGTLTSAGLADIVSKTSGSSSVAGRIKGNKLYAEKYGLRYSSEKRSFSSDVAFQSGTVKSSAVAPKVTRPKKDYIPVSKRQLSAVVDPLSGLMIKAKGTPKDICGRTLPFYDGWSRLDLKMSAAGTRPFKTDGFEGEAIVCNVRIQPVSGYRSTSRGLKFIEKQTIELWFAPIGKTGIFAPVYAKIPTEIGPLVLRASIFAKG